MFMHLEKAYDTFNRLSMWQMLRVCWVGGKWLKIVKGFYVDSRACVLMGMDVSEWFLLKVGLRQGCVVSPGMFNIYIYIFMWCWGKMLGYLGKRMELPSMNGGRFEINQLLFADDTALMADSEEKLCWLVSEFGRVCKSRKLSECL